MCNVVDEVSFEDLAHRYRIHHDEFIGSMWLAASSVSLYDFQDQDTENNFSKLRIETSQGFTRIHLKRNLRNGSHLLEKSFKIQGDVIEKGVKAGYDQMHLENENSVETHECGFYEPLKKLFCCQNKDEEDEINRYENPKKEKYKDSKNSQGSKTEEIKTENGVEGGSQINKTIKTGAEDDKKEETESREIEIEEMVEARIVSTCTKSAIYKGPKHEAFGSHSIPGLKPIRFRVEQAEKFLANELSQRLFEKKEVIVMLGNEHEDIQWMLKHLTKKGDIEEMVTIYNPISESEITES